MGQFSVTGSYKKVAQDAYYYYAVGLNSLSILDRFNFETIGYATITGGFSDVWTNMDSRTVLLGTTSGIYQLDKERVGANYNLVSSLTPDIRSQELDSLNVLALDSNSNNDLIVGTPSGVQCFYNDIPYTIDLYKPVQCVKVLTTGFYFGGAFGLAYKSRNLLNNLAAVDFLLNTLSTPALPSSYVSEVDIRDTEFGRLLNICTNAGLALVLINETNIRQSNVEYYV